MRYLKYIIVLMASVVLSGCSITYNTTFSPDPKTLRLHPSDLEYLGESEISVEYDTYVLIFRHLNKINGVKYEGKKPLAYADINGSLFAGSRLADKKLMRRASCKLLEEFPDATYFMVSRQTKHKEHLFLGSEVTVTATVKAYKLKTN